MPVLTKPLILMKWVELRRSGAEKDLLQGILSLKPLLCGRKQLLKM